MAVSDNSYIVTGADMVGLANKIREKAGVSNGLVFPNGMIEAIEGIETGGGSSWTDSYSVFATGTFTPVENVVSVEIDTGVPFDCSNGTNYQRQSLIIYREQNGSFITGVATVIVMSQIGEIDNSSYQTVTGGMISFSSGLYGGKALKANATPFPEEGESIWTVVTNTSVTSSTRFSAGASYRWLLLGVLK